MATSGWQTEKFYHASGNAGVVDWYGNINITSITHSGTNLRVVGQFRLAARGSSGYYASYVYGMKGSMTNSSGSKIGSTQTLLTNGQTLYVGSTVTKDFDITISGVSESTTSYSLGFRMWACYNSSCSSTYWDVTKYWTINFDTSSVPSGLYINNISSTYNSVSATVGLGSYNSSSSDKYLEMLVLTQTYVAGLPHKYSGTSSGALTYTTTVSNSSNCADAGCITIKGAGTYYTGVYAKAGSAVSRLAGPAVYTPPAPMSSLTYSQTQQAQNVKIDVSTVGGSSSDNNSDSVTTYMRYSTNGGSSYSNWTSMGTGNAWSTYTGSFTCNYGANVVIQTKQTYQSKDSTVKSVSFTATTGTAPSNLNASITSSTWNSAVVSGSCSYGTPSAAADRYMVLGLNINDSSIANRREASVGATTSGSTTINNSSANKGGTFDLKGMLPVYPFVYVNNTSRTASSIKSVYYLPPAPGTLSYSKDVPLIYTINYIGVPANNYDSYDAADLTRTVRYKIDDSQWWYIENDSNVALDYLTDYDVGVALGETLYVEAWMTYKGKNSEVSAFQVAGTERPVQMYGSVNDAAKEIQHLYGSLNGETVKIKKLYGSVGGVAKEVFEDV